MLESYFVQTCSKVTYTRNEWGGYERQSLSSLPCRWRKITSIIRGETGEQVQTDALVHVDKNTSLDKGDILIFEGYSYQVERITVARRLGETDIQFLKADVRILESVIS